MVAFLNSRHLLSVANTRGVRPWLSNRWPSRTRSSTNTPPLSILPSRTSARTFPVCYATRSIGNMDNATMNHASSAAPASSWVGHQGAAAFDLRSEYPVAYNLVLPSLCLSMARETEATVFLLLLLPPPINKHGLNRTEPNWT